jgi:hypothetical protein
MASIRNLKKDINALTFDLLGQCYAIKRDKADIRDEAFDEIIRKIVFLRNDLILRINHPETDAENASLTVHYRKVKEDLYSLLGVIDELKKK